MFNRIAHRFCRKAMGGLIPWELFSVTIDLFRGHRPPTLLSPGFAS